MPGEERTLSDYIKHELGYDEPIDPDTDLLEEGILDSFTIVQVAVFIQDHFGVELAPEDVVRANLGSISDMVALIDRRRSAGA